ncbi:hypothetical protein ABVK25_008160 [Lepraria finkii]|uniref:Uncharacterized protein n=1 Tax=Lepraria finkii TaxID=1340010 RepID=A0ABR4B279_9LECA
MRDQRLEERGGKRVDDVEFTFTKGRWGHLGEATLVNRVRSHQDVGEKWYPDILKRIRDEQAAARKTAEEAEKPVARDERQEQGISKGDGAQAIRAH